MTTSSAKIMRRVAIAVFALAAYAPAQKSEADILAVLEGQAADWNRGDLNAFVAGYDAGATFVGETVTHGAAQLLERYRSRYPSREKMGHLVFSALEVHVLNMDCAYVVGRWRLARKPEDGGAAGGVFSLVFHKTFSGWKIILDHTS